MQDGGGANVYLVKMKILYPLKKRTAKSILTKQKSLRGILIAYNILMDIEDVSTAILRTDPSSSECRGARTAGSFDFVPPERVRLIARKLPNGTFKKNSSDVH